ncbi:hypothetical protein AB6A40_001104 [Gnathostoma spinigerum]|uniref:J domain-containing protein n=1 Tax=Gnathostoma spinigerum TaxID=75299 RepID=A0ABD6E4F4_9BILA
MSFLEECRKHFSTTSLYDLLNLKRCDSLTQSSIKKAFYKLSMQWHPDRFNSVSEEQKQIVTAKFQIINKAYAILGDKEKRKIYDETGIVDDDVVTDDVDWMAKWRLIFKKVTIDDIKKFVEEYRGSDEEKKDVKRAYEKHGGDMSRIMDDIMGATYEDEDRIRKILVNMIENHEIVATKVFTNEPKSRKDKRMKAAKKEAKEAEKALKEIVDREGTNSLEALIQKRQLKRSQDSFLDNLLSKYSGTKKPRRSK